MSITQSKFTDHLKANPQIDSYEKMLKEMLFTNPKSTAEIADRYDMLAELRDVLNGTLMQYSELVKSEIDAGRPVDGFVIGKGRNTRKITSQLDAVTAMTKYVNDSDLFEEKLIGIPAMEKLLKGKNLTAPVIENTLDKFVTVVKTPGAVTRK